MRLFVVAACLALLIAGRIRAGTTPPTDTAQQQTEAVKKAETAEKSEAELRRDAAERLITLRQQIWAEQRNATTKQLADRIDDLLLDLIAGKPTSELNSQIETIHQGFENVRGKPAHATQAIVTGAVSQGASSGKGRSFGTGLAVLLSLGSLALSLFLYLRRRHVVEQTLRDAGLL